MPTQKKTQPAVGSLVQCRVTTGTFTYTCTRKILKVLANGKRFVLDGKGTPTVERKNIAAISRVIPIS